MLSVDPMYLVETTGWEPYDQPLNAS